MYKIISRFNILYRDNLIYLFNQSAEKIKIGLSDQDYVDESIDYLGEEFTISKSRQELRLHITSKAEKMRDMIEEAKVAAGTEPDYIYFTGGSSKSPVLIDLLLDRGQRHKVVSGDNFSSVAKGLVLAAKRRFG